MSPAGQFRIVSLLHDLRRRHFALLQTERLLVGTFRCRGISQDKTDRGAIRQIYLLEAQAESGESS